MYNGSRWTYWRKQKMDCCWIRHQWLAKRGYKTAKIRSPRCDILYCLPNRCLILCAPVQISLQIFGSLYNWCQVLGGCNNLNPGQGVQGEESLSIAEDRRIVGL